MAILYVAAEAAELQTFAGALLNLKKLKWPLDYAQEGILSGKRIMLAANGAGPKLAGQAVEVAIRAFSAADLSTSKLEAVVSVGLCGALDSSLQLDDIVVGTSVTTSVGGEPEPCDPVSDAPQARSGMFFSQDRVAGTAEEKRKLAASGALAVEMEAAGVLARTKRAGLPCYCIKVVSDTADEGFALDLNALRTIEGRIARGKIIIHALSRPNRFPGIVPIKAEKRTRSKGVGGFSC